ncbi:MAG: 2-dehydropantoate 2-reductase [Deltaproteobacteria bacterium]|nr:2-dehydropantoate 2-reductase [Deltaproteobacteria bacterium]
MRITVVGGGAMGCLFGGCLSRAGDDVVLVDAWRDHVELLNRRGLWLWEGSERREIPVRAELPGSPLRRAELVLFLVKAYRSEEAAAQVPDLLEPAGLALTLQNGLGSADVLAARVGRERVLVGVTAQGATVLGPGEIRHGGTGETLVGAYAPNHASNAGASRAAEAFGRANLPARATSEVWPAVWKKLAVNCGINAVTALAGIRNGRIPEIPEAAAVLEDAVHEAAAVARAAGVDLGDPGALVDHVLAVARATAANRSSMGQDVDRRSPTEIDFINGAVVREGRKHGVPTPVNATLARLVKAVESGFQ